MREITFPTASPLTFRAAAEGRGGAATGLGILFLPGAAARPKSRPAVVIVSDLGGPLPERELRYGAAIAREGTVALVVDSGGARGTGRRMRRLRLTESVLAQDAFAALRHLTDHPMVDPDRIAVMGSGIGGQAALLCAFEQVRAALAEGALRFAAHAALHPCPAVRLADIRSTGAPVRIFAPGRGPAADDARLRALAGDLRRGGARVEFQIFPGAASGWDAPRHEPRFTGRLVVAEDLVTRDERTGLPVRGTLSRALASSFCRTDPTEPDPEVTVLCTDELVAFLASSLGRPAYPPNVIPLPLRRRRPSRSGAAAMISME